MKKKSILIIAVTAITFLVISVLSFLIGTGLTVRTDVVLIDYSVSVDGTKLTFRTAIPASMGYIRGFEDQGGGVKPHYLTFYSTFGGLNSSLGAKDQFELELADTDTEIYLNRPNGGYVLVLQKNAGTGQWERP